MGDCTGLAREIFARANSEIEPTPWFRIEVETALTAKDLECVYGECGHKHRTDSSGEFSFLGINSKAVVAEHLISPDAEPRIAHDFVGQLELPFSDLGTENNWFNVLLQLNSNGMLADFLGEEVRLTFWGQTLFSGELLFSDAGGYGHKVTFEQVLTPKFAILEGGESQYVVVSGSGSQAHCNSVLPMQVLGHELEDDLVALSLSLTWDQGGEFSRLTFVDPEDPASVECLDSFSFTIAADDSSLSLTADWTAGGIPIPQANSVPRLIEFASLVNGQQFNDAELARSLSISRRQIGYYGNAGRTLGIFHRVDRTYWTTTELGQSVLVSASRDLAFAKLIGATYSAFLKSLPPGSDLASSTLEWFVDRNSKNSQISGSTIKRRASSLIAWLVWMENVASRNGYQVSQLWEESSHE